MTLRCTVPREVLSAIFHYAQEMDLFRELPAGQSTCKGKMSKVAVLYSSTPQDLGPPPAEEGDSVQQDEPSRHTDVLRVRRRGHCHQRNLVGIRGNTQWGGLRHSGQ